MHGSSPDPFCRGGSARLNRATRACHLKRKRTQFYAKRVVFLAMDKLKCEPTITSSIPNYISKADAYFDRVDLRVQSAESVTY